jgi:hypothetical protein
LKRKESSGTLISGADDKLKESAVYVNDYRRLYTSLARDARKPRATQAEASSLLAAGPNYAD